MGYLERNQSSSRLLVLFICLGESLLPIRMKDHSKEPYAHALGTIPYDPRFPNQNQTRNCFQNYLDFYRCTNLRGEDYEPCQYFKKSFKTICPNDWIARWDEQREEGRFPADLTK